MIFARTHNTRNENGRFATIPGPKMTTRQDSCYKSNNNNNNDDVELTCENCAFYVKETIN